MLRGGHQGRRTLQIPTLRPGEPRERTSRSSSVIPAGGLDVRSGGDDGARTHDLLVANQALYQLSYVPVTHRTQPAVLADVPTVRQQPRFPKLAAKPFDMDRRRPEGKW